MRETGKIIKYFEDRGFGFVFSESIGGQLFFHVSQVKFDPLQISRGVTVSYSIEQSGEKPRAIEIERAPSPSSDGGRRKPLLRRLTVASAMISKKMK